MSEATEQFVTVGAPFRSVYRKFAGWTVRDNRGAEVCVAMSDDETIVIAEVLNEAAARLKAGKRK